MNAANFRIHYGPWALVTGASSGMGLHISRHLAALGINLVLNGRNVGALISLSAALKAEHGVDVEMVALDLSSTENVVSLIKNCNGKDVGLVVLAAGFGTSGPFVLNPITEELNMVQVNCLAVLQLTHHFARLFASRRRGGIVLFSSLVAFQGTPAAANYAATKAYIQNLAEALAVELASHQVDVLCVIPGPVNSGFAKRANMAMNIFVQASDVALPVIRALGRKRSVVPGFVSKLLVYSLRLMPRWGKVRIMQRVMGEMTKHSHVLK